MVLGAKVKLKNLVEKRETEFAQVSEVLEKSKTLESEFENAKEEVKRPFDKEDELQEKSNRLSELNKELDIGNKDEKEAMSFDEVQFETEKDKSKER